MPTPDPYAVLGVTSDATDAIIRTAFLKLTVQFTPEHNPIEFARIRTAYETIRTLYDRAKFALYVEPVNDSLDLLAEAALKAEGRPRPTLEQLLATFRKDTV